MGEAPHGVVLRPMTEHDVPLIHRWLQAPHLAEWWGDAGFTLAETQAGYSPAVMAVDQVTPYIAMRGGRAIGFAQSYLAMGSGDGWWDFVTDPGVRGIDQFLAHSEDLGQGLGTQMVEALVELLFRDPAVTLIQTDPDPGNHRAIRCYEKAGFRAVEIVTTPDGPALYMVRERKAHPL
ncbi:GNAT family N-acetyltransferase [Paucibacter sp. O1-1]|nr:GNAT family N-acetyltransferase [Paucibacter sp. O1-1]MDA3827383.1 GNAT family N-acetyltransferase [Paucibacter sp. O1-1]